MSIRISQRLIALSFLVGVSAIFALFVRIFALAEISLSFSLPIIAGLLGWACMVGACIVVLFHPKPENSFLGRFAFAKEPLFHTGLTVERRSLVTFAVMTLAAFAVFVAVFFFTDLASELYNKVFL
jgi:hypothetical protein